VLSVSVLAIMYGILAALWQAGVLFGARNLGPDLPLPSASTAPLFLWLVPAALLHALLAVAMAAAGVASLGLKRWGLRTLVGVATADLVLQALVLLTGLAWVAPATQSQHLASGAARAARPTLEAAAGTQWLVLWFALSLFPAVVVGVLARRHVRQAYDAAANSAAVAAESADELVDPYF
jgi:hypothetical protein